MFIHNNRLTKFTILIQKAPEGGYIGQCLEILAAISRGETLEELKTNRKGSMVLALELIKDLKKDAILVGLEINIQNEFEKLLME